MRSSFRPCRLPSSATTRYRRCSRCGKQRHVSRRAADAAYADAMDVSSAGKGHAATCSAIPNTETSAPSNTRRPGRSQASAGAPPRGRRAAIRRSAERTQSPRHEVLRAPRSSRDPSFAAVRFHTNGSLERQLQGTPLGRQANVQAKTATRRSARNVYITPDFTSPSWHYCETFANARGLCIQYGSGCASSHSTVAAASASAAPCRHGTSPAGRRMRSPAASQE